MGLRIGTNVAALAAQRNLSVASNALAKNYTRLSTGSRIASASDDAAGLAISARLQAQIRGLDQAARNANDGLSLVTTAEAALAETQESIIRMRELAVQSSNGTLSTGDRTNLQAEFTQLLAQVGQIADSTSFNDIQLLNAASALTLQVGTSGAATSQLTFSTVDADATGLGINAQTIATTTGARAAITALDAALVTVTGNRGTLGAVMNRLGVAVNSLSARSENLSAANSRIIDVDIAFETAELTKNSILQQSALSVLAQANNAPSAALALLG